MFNFNQMFGAIPSPILMNKCDVYWENAVLWNMSNFGEMVDSNSIKYNFHMNEGYFGTQELRQIPLSAKYDKLFVDTTARYLIDDTKPLYEIDTSKLKVGSTTPGDYQGISHITDYSSGNITTSTVYDPIYGDCLVVTSTGDTNTTKFLRAQLTVMTPNMPIETGEYITVAITIKPLANVPTGNTHKYYASPDNRYAMAFGTKEKIKDKYTTILCASKKGDTQQAIFGFQFDQGAGTETCETAQSYEIANVAIFKGLHFGDCKSKVNIIPKFIT